MALQRVVSGWLLPRCHKPRIALRVGQSMHVGQSTLRDTFVALLNVSEDSDTFLEAHAEHILTCVILTRRDTTYSLT